jgi:hypothetical protein
MPVTTITATCDRSHTFATAKSSIVTLESYGQGKDGIHELRTIRRQGDFSIGKEGLPPKD